jgi:hypothetical protein
MTILGLSSVAINSDTVIKDPELWNKVQRGDYRLVYATPESILKATSPFWRLLRKSKVCSFLQNLVLVALDECHCINEWHEFRPNYQLIGPMRLLLPTVTFMGLSATLTSSSVGFITKTANLRNPNLIQRSIARPNITITVHKICSGFDQLDFMVPKTAFLPHKIPLAMVFIDNINDGMEVVNHLQNCLHPRLRHRASKLIRIYNGDLDSLTRKTYLDDFRNGDTRILVGTDAMGMGIDIRRIQTVVQWRISPVLNMSVLYQRIGRAGRDPMISAYAKIFVQPMYLIDNMSNPWLDANGIEDKALESMFPSSGRHSRQQCVPPVSTTKSYNKFKELLATPVDQIHASINDNFQQAIRSHRRQMIERLGKDVVNNTKIDLFLVWFINTTKCRHRVFHLVFNEPDLYKDMGNTLCCECCHVERDGSAGIDLLGIPIHETVGCQANQPWLDKWARDADSLPSSTSKPRMLLPSVSKPRLKVLVSDLRHWRNSLERSSGNVHGLSAKQFLRDDAIDKIRARIRYIKTENNLREVLLQVGYRFPAAFISDLVPDLHQCIQHSLSNTLHLQGRKRLTSPTRSVIPEAALRPKALPWLRTIAELDMDIRTAQDQLEQERQLALQKEKEEKERERNKAKGLLKRVQEQERKREVHRDREKKRHVLAARYEREKKAEARKQKEIDRKVLGDITNESKRRSQRKRQCIDRWEG